jgi:hypothetical protein
MAEKKQKQLECYVTSLCVWYVGSAENCAGDQ